MEKINVLKSLIVVIIITCWTGSCKVNDQHTKWMISVLPPSVRLDPSTNEIIHYRFDGLDGQEVKQEDLLSENWIYDGERVILHGARGEYISYQLVVSNFTSSAMTGVQVSISPFENEDIRFDIHPELFLEWSVEIKETSTGYPKASLGKGWYPDALIPFEFVQADSAEVERRWIYPLEIPDFNNRIDDQSSMIIWVDQYIPIEVEKAKPGIFYSTITVSAGEKQMNIPVELTVWDFAIPNENLLKASFTQAGFLSRVPENKEIEIFHLFKRNRIGLMDYNYKPDLKESEGGDIRINWEWFDKRMEKYYTGKAFTSAYGYEYGPGYGEPIETFILPFNVPNKHGERGWPNVGDIEVERHPENKARYTRVIKEVREHLRTMVDPQKTELTVFLNGLDESYFPEAWDRMAYYGDLFKQEYPEARFRVDGAYSEEAMEVIQNSISSWASHTLNYDIDKMSKYQTMGIEDWIYGPMLYEDWVNSWSGSSTFTDLPLVNDRAISWCVWKYNAYSWLQWGIGYHWESAWYDPESWKDRAKRGSKSDKGYPYKKLNGNALLVYAPGIVPNVNEPCPSIRLKAFRNGVQEYEYLRLLSKLDGSEARADSVVNTIIGRPFGSKSVGNLDVWSYDPAEWDRARINIGEMIHAKSE